MANIKDVAKLAGVSVTTVSRVLNNKGYISQDTYESVYRAIDQLDYVPNQIARNLLKTLHPFLDIYQKVHSSADNNLPFFVLYPRYNQCILHHFSSMFLKKLYDG